MSDDRKSYPRPSLTADVVALALDADGDLRLLCIRRGQPPFQGCWALPGGFCEPTETVKEAAARELTEETQLRGVALEELRCFSTPGRDPRGWVVSVAHLALLPRKRMDEARAGDDASETAWLTLRIARSGAFQLEHGGAPLAATALAFDHREVIAVAVAALRERVDTLAFSLLPTPFSLSEAQTAFEAILGAPLDPRAFAQLMLEDARVYEATLPDRALTAETRYLPEVPLRRWPWAVPPRA